MCELQSYSFQYLGRRFLLQPHVAIVKSNVSYTYNRKLQECSAADLHRNGTGSTFCAYTEWT